MNYCLSSFEMKESDSYTIANFTPSIELMERAGRGIFDYIKDNFDDSYRILIVVGSGNNGGDGLVAARYLHNFGYDVDVYIPFGVKTQEAFINKEKLRINPINNLIGDEKLIVVDSIFGIGLNKNVEGKYKDLIDKINKLKKYKTISIDIASGINADNGYVLGNAIKADITLTLGEFKLGHFLNEGKDYSGEVIRIDIGIKLPNYRKYIRVLDKNDYKIYFPKRMRNSNKGTYKKVTQIGGTSTTPGALELSKKAYLALKMGVGYSQVAFPKSLKFIYNMSYPEIIYVPLKEKFDGTIKFNKKDLKKLLSSEVITLGMGIGVSKDIYKMISYLLINYSGKLVLDADALNTLAKYGVGILENHKCDVILTPHLKEFSRLSGFSVDEIKYNRIKLGVGFSSIYNVVLVLKDSTTLIFNNDLIYLNHNGNSALAKGGSGDILSGILTGVLNFNDNNVEKKFPRGNNLENSTLKDDPYKVELSERCALASYILGRSSEILVNNKKLSERVITGSDVINNLNEVIKELEGE